MWERHQTRDSKLYAKWLEKSPHSEFVHERIQQWKNAQDRIEAWKRLVSALKEQTENVHS